MTPDRQTPREQAYQACTEIFLQEARFPTVDLVVEAIGVNNRRMASEVIKQWRQDLAQRFREHQLEVPEPIRRLWKQAMDEAHKALAEEHEQLEQARQVLAAERESWQKTLDERNREISRLQEQLAERDATVAKLEQERDGLQDRLEERQSELSAARQEIGQIRGQLQEVQSQLDKTQQRLDGMIDWANRRIEEERGRIAREWSQKLARAEQETTYERLERQKAEARLGQAEERMDLLLGQLKTVEVRLAEKEREIALLRQEKEQLAEENQRLSEMVVRLEQGIKRSKRRRPFRSFRRGQ